MVGQTSYFALLRIVPDKTRVWNEGEKVTLRTLRLGAESKSVLIPRAAAMYYLVGVVRSVRK